MSVADENNVHFEEALSKAGFGVYSFSIMALAGASVISFACIFYSSTIIVPISACELGTTSAQQGLLAAVPIIGSVLGAMVWGQISDNYGRKNILLISLLAGAAVNAAASLSTSWIALLALQFVTSLLISGQYSLSMTILSESVPQEKRNLAVLAVNSLFMLSSGIMSVIAMPIIPLEFSLHIPYLDIEWNSWRTVLLVYSLPSLLTACWLHSMQESPKFVFSRGDSDRALEILKAIHKTNHRYGEEFQVRHLLHEDRECDLTAANGGNHFLMLFRRPLLKRTIIMTSLFLLLQLLAFKVWLPKIAHRFMAIVQTREGNNLTLCEVLASSAELADNQLPFDAPTVAGSCKLDTSALFVVLAVAVMLSITNIIITWMVTCIGRRYAVMAVTAVCGLAGVLVNAPPHAFVSGALFLLQLMGVVALGLYTALNMELFPTQLRALAMTFAMSGERVANFMSIQIVNYLLVHNCELAFYVYGTLLACSALVATFLPDDSPWSQPQHEIMQEYDQ